MTGAHLPRVRSSGLASAHGTTCAPERTQGHTGGRPRSHSTRHRASGVAASQTAWLIRTSTTEGVSRHLKDPAVMSPEDRLAELGALLATGLRRARLSRETGLADCGERERPCVSVDTPEDPADQEVA